MRVVLVPHPPGVDVGKRELPERRKVGENGTKQLDVRLERTGRFLSNKLRVMLICQLGGGRIAPFAERGEMTLPLLLRVGHGPGSVVYGEVVRCTE